MLNALDGNARFVGGAVRDTIMARAVSDIDLATPLPRNGHKKLDQAGLKAIPTGLKHGTVTAVANGRPFEVTTLREDVETYGRHARVAFTDNWQRDASRRDFSFNALYADGDGRVYDYFDGIDDARAGRVRFIGDATTRIREDALRILRFFRFNAWYGSRNADSDGLAACAAERDLIDMLSIERVRQELLRLLSAPEPTPVLEAMIATGVYAKVFETKPDLNRFRSLVELERKLGKTDSLRRFHALSQLDASEASKRFRLSNPQAKRLAGMVPVDQTLQAEMTEQDIQHALYRYGRVALADQIILNGALEDVDALQTLLVQVEQARIPKFPIAGQDLLDRGFPPGPEVGERLKALEQHWINSNFTLGRETLLEKI